MNALRWVAVAALILIFHAPPIAAQDAGAGGKKGARKSGREKRRFDRRSKRNSKRTEKSRRELELLSLGPGEYRAKEAEVMLEIASHMYEFEPAQRAQVEQEVARIQDTWWRSTPEVSELEAMLTQRQSMFNELSGGLDAAEDPGAQLKKILKDREFAKLNSQIRRFERENPRVFMEHREQIEAVLDPECVNKAEKKWARRSSRLRGKVAIPGLIRGLTSRRQMRQARDKSGKASEDGKAKSIGNPVQKPSVPRPPAARADQRKPRQTPKARPRKERPPPSAKAELTRPLNEWEKYVLDFIDKYDLTPTQRNSAMSILRELTSCAVQIEKANMPRIEAAEKISDANERRKRLAKLNEPLDALFQALKQRLDQLLTASQRTKSSRK